MFIIIYNHIYYIVHRVLTFIYYYESYLRDILFILFEVALHRDDRKKGGKLYWKIQGSYNFFCFNFFYNRTILISYLHYVECLKFIFSHTNIHLFDNEQYPFYHQYSIYKFISNTFFCTLLNILKI